MPDDTRTPEAGQTQEGDSDLTDAWAAVRAPSTESIEDRLVRQHGRPHPGVLTIATSSGRIIVQIDPNGKITYGEGYTPNDAAEEFWTLLALKRPGMEERLKHFARMEMLLQQVGRASLDQELAQAPVGSTSTTMEERAHARETSSILDTLLLELLAHCREMARRAGL